MSRVREWTSRLRASLSPGGRDRELEEELRQHLEFAAEEARRRGGAEHDIRATRVKAGGITQAMEAVRAQRGVPALEMLLQDLKLGARLLLRYPGLTFVGGLGIAVAVAIAVGFFSFFVAYVHPRVPLPDGHRLIGIQTWDAASGREERRVLHDYVVWRESLTSVEELGAFRTTRRNAAAGNGPTTPVAVAEITASGFLIAGVSPLLGRYLTEADQAIGAPPVVVVGHDLWQSHFGASVAAIGQLLHLGTRSFTVVGIMPAGFAFPVNHQAWVALPNELSRYERRQGPAITVFGRLRSTATVASAQAELATVGARIAAAFPETHAQLRPRARPYTELFMDESVRLTFYAAQLLVAALLLVIFSNVAILVYARTLARQGEITVRSALGASRRRLVAQSFGEALVLSALAAVIGVELARQGLLRLDVLVSSSRYFPYWFSPELSLTTGLLVVGVTVVAAAVIGVVPALKATGPVLEATLRQLRGGPGLQLGRTWTALSVLQVAVAMAFLPPAVLMGWNLARHALNTPGFQTDRFVAAQIQMDREVPATSSADTYRRDFVQQFEMRLAELENRLLAEPDVAGVTMASGIPGYEAEVFLELETNAPGPAPSRRVQLASVRPDFFETFSISLLAGRTLDSRDLASTSDAVVVNQAFVQDVMDGTSPIGRRVRIAGRVDDDEGLNAGPGPWLEIVGVVEDAPAQPLAPGMLSASVYRPLVTGDGPPVHLLVATRGSVPIGLAGRLRTLIHAIDPSLRLEEVVSLDVHYRNARAGLRWTAIAVGITTLSVVLLSAAGIYALMSFTVARRRKEIGIRCALGARTHHVVTTVFSRAVMQLGLGIASGTAAVVLLDGLTGGETMGGKALVLLPIAAVLMLVVGTLAALGPARKVLGATAMAALREE